MAENALKITPDFIISLILRRRWIVLLPFCLAIVVGIVLSFVLPKVFEAKTLIFVDPQSVPENYVQAIVTEDAATRINTISQQILSRSNLEKIIQDFGLFKDPEQKDLFMEDKVAMLRRAISVDVIAGADRRRGPDAFTISFKGKEPETVARVANGLASYFINENLKVRETQAIGTSTFLDSQLEEMRQHLERVEEKIKEYRKSYMGELPEQLDTNLRILDRLQENLTDRQNVLRDARLRLAELETQTTSRPQSVVVISGEQRRNEGTASLEDLRAELETLQSKYTDKHPDIIRFRKMIAELEAKSRADLAQNGSQNAPITYIPAQIRVQMTDVQREISLTETEIESLKAQINEYNQRIEATPKREQELLGLRRDYQNIQTTYESLLSRKLEADIAVNMERKQKGEQFRVIDPARVPQRPAEPNLKVLFALVTIAGLGIGGGIAFLIEFLKPTFRNPEEIETIYDLPVIATIPTIYSPRQILWRTIDHTASVIFSIITIGLMAVFAFICVTGGDMVVNAIKKMI